MKIIVLSAVLAVLMISGCKSTPPMYEYGEYSESFYALKKDPDVESNAQWKASLEEVIELSNARAIRVPPGVFANLGYIHLKSNNKEQAIKYFEREKSTYPEATKFMDNLIQKAKLQG